MALFSQATDLQTRSTVWVSRNVVKGRPQLSSHRDDIIGRGMDSDGLPAAELANLHTPFVGWLKQVVAELRKVIWPNRKQMVNYTAVVLVFLVFMVALISGVDLGFARVMLLVFG